MKADYEWKERMSVRLLSNREEERRSHNGRPYSTGSCRPIGGLTSLSLLTGLLVFAESFPNSNQARQKAYASGQPSELGSESHEGSSTLTSGRFGQTINEKRVISLLMGHAEHEVHFLWCMPHNPRGSLSRDKPLGLFFRPAPQSYNRSSQLLSFKPLNSLT